MNLHTLLRNKDGRHEPTALLENMEYQLEVYHPTFQEQLSVSNHFGCQGTTLHNFRLQG